MGVKYVVVCGSEKGVFYNYESAREFFIANWCPGMVWSLTKYENGKVVA